MDIDLQITDMAGATPEHSAVIVKNLINSYNIAEYLLKTINNVNRMLKETSDERIKIDRFD